MERASYLRKHGRTDEAEPWGRLIQQNYKKIIELWERTIAAPSLRFGLAVEMSRAGDAAAAHRMLLKLEGHFVGSQRNAYLIERARAALALGNKADATRDLEAIYADINNPENLTREFDNAVDSMIRRAEKGADPVQNALARINELVGLRASKQVLLRETAELAVQQDLRSESLKPLLDEYRRNHDLPAVERAESTGLKFEEYEEE